MKIIFRNPALYQVGRFVVADVVVDGGVVSSIGVAGEQACDLEVDCTGLHLLPGLVDLHVHLREPGYSYKETIASGTRAAAHGGYTTVCSMPNLRPVPDSVEHLQEQLSIIERDAVVKVIPYGSITVGQKGEGELVDFEALSPNVVAFSDDGKGVQSGEDMERAMTKAAEVGKAIVAHCEVDELLRGGYIHDGEWARERGHRGICSESEWQQVVRDIELAAKTGCQYHVCHVSTKESVEAVAEAKRRGLRVSCETAPHYLLMCDENMEELGRFKMNPPLRSREDRDALVAALQNGVIDVVATDHAPHSAEEKSRGLELSAMGVVGLESAFGLLYKHLVLEGVISLERLVEVMAILPRKIFGLPSSLVEGKAADLVLMDLGAEGKVDPSTFVSMGRATPFEGWACQGETVMTMVDGKIVYSNGKVAEKK